MTLHKTETTDPTPAAPAGTMKAFQVTEIGRAPEWRRVPAPAPGAGEIALDIAACGLNFADLLMIEGRYQDMPPAPFTLGLEAAGTVTAVGAGVTDMAPGQRVAVFGGHGGLAERAVVPRARAVPIPDGMSMAEAAGFQIAYGTSHLALDHAARLREGETLLVTGAAGGVGLTAVELGARMGARVIAAARGAEKLEVARAAGAAHLIDTGQQDLREAVRALGGADVVYECVGDPLFTEALRATRPGGRILAIGFAGGEVPRIKANHLLVKNISVIGLYWGGYLTFAPEVLARSLAALMEMYAAGKLRPHVSHLLPADRAAEGLELLRSRAATGKVVIDLTA